MAKDLNIDQLTERFAKSKVLILGDVMLDAYYWGSVSRISPEAPVPVVSLEKREYRLGGAANVAINIKAMGATPILCSFIGNDDHAGNFEERLKVQGMHVDGIFRMDGRKTTVKRRVIGNNHQLLRVDEETEEELNSSQKESYQKHVESMLNKHDIDVIIIEDYDKGSIYPEIIKHVTDYASSKGIPVTVDPKKDNFLNFRNIDMFKPNLHELKEGLRISSELNSVKDITESIKPFMKENGIKSVLITLSEKGVYYKDENSEGIIPAHLRNIADVSGAGDTVISVASLCLAADLSLDKIAELSNLAGGLVCEKVGVVPIDLGQWRNELAKHNIL